MKQDCNGSEVAPGDRRDVASIGPDILSGDPDTMSNREIQPFDK